MYHRLVLKSLTTYVFSAIFLHSFVNATECPPSDLIQPCKCEKEFGRLLNVMCVGLTYHEDLRKVFNKVDGWKFDGLYILECSMLYIPSSIFENSQFRLLSIRRSTLTSLFDTVPVSVKSIKDVEIFFGTFHQGIGWKYFKNFELDSLRIHASVIRELGKDFKENFGSSKVRLLSFVTNGIRRLTNQPFENLHNLDDLYLENQKFKDLEPLIFPQELKKIMLRSNNLRSLPDHFFGERPQLVVEITDNQLTGMPKAVFGGLHSVYIDGNPIVCNCGMKWTIDEKYKLSYIGGHCASPSTVKGKFIPELKASDFNYCA